MGMTVRYNIISYLIGDGIKNIAKNKKSTFTAIIIMVITIIMDFMVQVTIMDLIILVLHSIRIMLL